MSHKRPSSAEIPSKFALNQFIFSALSIARSYGIPRTVSRLCRQVHTSHVLDQVVF